METLQRVSDERALIGCLLTDLQFAERCLDIVQPTEFVDQALGKLFAYLCSLGPTLPEDKIAFARHPSVEAIGLVDVVRMQKQCIDPGYSVVYADSIARFARKNTPDPDASISSAVSLFDAFIDDIESGKQETVYMLPDPLTDLEIGPGLITIIGAGPGAGKTAFASQVAFSALELDKRLTLTIANAEMRFRALMSREIQRRTSISGKTLRKAELTDAERPDWNRAKEELAVLMRRVSWVNPPYNALKLTELLDRPPGMLIVDYLQKFAPSDKDSRQGVNDVMTLLRRLANEGWGIIALSATSRTQSKSGGGHDGKSLTLASFRESGEIEYNADSAYLLRDLGEHDGISWIREIELSCAKNRAGEKDDRQLLFNAAGMRFESAIKNVTNWETGEEYDDMEEMPF